MTSPTDTAAPTQEAPPEPPETPLVPAPEPVPGAEVTLYGHDVPQRLADQIKLAEAIYATNLMPPACRSVAGVMAALRAAMAFNVPFWTVAQALHLIEGKVGYDASFIRGLVNRAGHRFRVLERSAEQARVRITRSDDPEPYEVTFTIDDARRAELLLAENGRIKKDQWRKYPAAMMVARATAIAVRDHCPEVLMGAGYLPEELGADTDADGNPLVTMPSERLDTPTTAERVTANAEQVKAMWRDDIENAPDTDAVQALYERAKQLKLLDRPLYDDGTTVEAALAHRAADLSRSAAEEVHDAEVVQDDDFAEHARPAPDDEPDPADPVTGVGASEPDSNDEAPAVAPAEPEEPTDAVQTPTDVPTDGAQPDDPVLCRDNAARRGVLTHLGNIQGDVDALTMAEYGLPVEQVATRRLLALARELGKRGTE